MHIHNGGILDKSMLPEFSSFNLVNLGGLDNASRVWGGLDNTSRVWGGLDNAFSVPVWVDSIVWSGEMGLIDVPPHVEVTGVFF